MKRTIPVASWERREHFEFFRKFDEPFFGVCASVDCTAAYKRAKEDGHSFFLTYLYASLQAVNVVPELRTRIENDQIVEYDWIHSASTIGRSDNSFGFSFIPFTDSFEEFLEVGEKEIARIEATPGLALNDAEIARADVIHYTAIPWISFTAMSHARRFSKEDTAPKIAFGKLTDEGDRKMLPVSVHVHHALVDGYHVGIFFEAFQQFLGNQE